MDNELINNFSSEATASEAWKAIEHEVRHEGHRQSLPIPVLKNKKVFIVFIYYGSNNRFRQPSILRHPVMVQTVEYPTGKMLDFHAPTPDEFGLKEWHDPIGELAAPHDMSYTDFIEAEKELLCIVDKLIPAFLLWNNRTNDDRGNIKRFNELFDKIGEPPLKPYYEAIGYNWFHWLKQ